MLPYDVVEYEWQGYLCLDLENKLQQYGVQAKIRYPFCSTSIILAKSCPFFNESQDWKIKQNNNNKR